MVDAGKIKLQSYDSSDESTYLATAKISKACAIQRAGRAGRTQNGYCYRLYTNEHFEGMQEYTVPEILRCPLTEICLKAKILAGKSSIEDFLLKAVQPPPVTNIRRSIEMLKTIGALDGNQNITSLGNRLVS